MTLLQDCLIEESVFYEKRNQCIESFGKKKKKKKKKKIALKIISMF